MFLFLLLFLGYPLLQLRKVDGFTFTSTSTGDCNVVHCLLLISATCNVVHCLLFVDCCFGERRLFTLDAMPYRPLLVLLVAATLFRTDLYLGVFGDFAWRERDLFQRVLIFILPPFLCNFLFLSTRLDGA